jgi:hypothetical protein
MNSILLYIINFILLFWIYSAIERMEDTGKTFFLSSALNILMANLLPKITDQITGTTLPPIFLSSNISNDRSSVRSFRSLITI